MPTDEFQTIRDRLAGRGDLAIEPGEFKASCLRLLAEAMDRFPATDTDAVGPADLAVLVRLTLRREQLRSRGAAPSLTIPATWPEPPDGWAAFSLAAASSDAGTVLSPLAWSRSWLPETARIEKSLLVGEPRRYFGEEVDPDPFLGEVLSHKGYRCPAQRQAVQAVLTAPPGATLLVLLPTGGGKSLCAQLPALLARDRLTIVVVPTVTLALDQDRAVRELSSAAPRTDARINHPTAYVGGADEVMREQRAAIRSRVRDGSQRIVFTSPEALLEPLFAEAAYTAARAGRLAHLVIDEAHVIDQWGDDFRPAFQELVGLRSDLIAACPREPFVTTLLSATVTPNCLDTLETLFSGPGPFRLCPAVQLRPEPEYHIVRCLDDGEKIALVLDALRHLPRPLILYVTRVDDAETVWRTALRDAGFRRFNVVTGRTDNTERSDIIDRWQRHQLDLVVATSAFGLGMDKDDVRCVVHACVPETVDRYYQEVGRGGRDGNACLSLLMYTQRDLSTARRLSERTLISVKKGFDRWFKMYEGRDAFGPDRVAVPVNAVPDYLRDTTDEENVYNKAWNVRTLTLLARVKTADDRRVLDLDAVRPEPLEIDPAATEDERIETFRRWRGDYQSCRVVRVLNDQIHYRPFWDDRVEALRRATDAHTERGLQFMLDVLEGRRCVADVLAEAYAIAPRGTRTEVRVARCCAGCPNDAAGISPEVLPHPAPVWDWQPSMLAPELAALFDGETCLALFDERFPDGFKAFGAERTRREEVVRRLIESGVRNVVGPAALLAELRTLVLRVTQAWVFFATEWRTATLARVPSLVLCPGGVSRAMAQRVIGPETRPDIPPVVVWLPANAPDPTRPDRRLFDTTRCPRRTLTEFLSEVRHG